MTSTKKNSSKQSASPLSGKVLITKIEYRWSLTLTGSFLEPVKTCQLYIYFDIKEDITLLKDSDVKEYFQILYRDSYVDDVEYHADNADTCVVIITPDDQMQEDIRQKIGRLYWVDK